MWHWSDRLYPTEKAGVKLPAESRRVLMLGLIACVLGSYTYLTASGRRLLSGQAGVHTARLVLNFAPHDVTQVSLVYNTQRLTCQRTAEGWQHTPSGLPIPTETIEDFLTNLSTLLHLGDVESLQTELAQTELAELAKLAELAQYGLQPPQASIHLRLAGQETRSLDIGTQNAAHGSLYAQINKTPQVILVGAIIAWDMRKVFIVANRSRV